MTSEIIIDVPGDPVAKGRARSAFRGFATTATGKKRAVIGHYTPAKTRTWEGIARSLAMDAMRGRPPLDGPLAVHIHIVLRIPESWPQWKKDLAKTSTIWPTVKPDSDNVEKAVKDALNGVAWGDDCQVVATTKLKFYGASPRVRIKIEPIAGHSAQIKTRPR